MNIDAPRPRPGGDRPIRRRRRPVVACNECRRRKIACDRKSPCCQCTLHRVNCVYGTTGTELHPVVTKRAASRTTSAVFPCDSRRDKSPIDSPSSQRAGRFQPPEPSQNESQLFIGYGNGVSDDRNSAGLDEMSRVLGPSLPQLRGRISKTRLFGQSHWTNNMVDQLKDIHSTGLKVFFDTRSELYSMLHECKILARALKSRRIEALQTSESTNFVEFFQSAPPKEVSDQLVNTYLRTFESVFRILHIPTFRMECDRYWSEPKAATETFMTKFLLTMAIGSCINDNANDLEDSLRDAAAQAIRKADGWHCAAIDKHRLPLDTIQIYCLVLLARQTSAEFGDDLVWISAGSLLHTSFTMGLHRDPSHFQGLSLYQIEMRRRLWATVLELIAQSSLDSGMPALIGPGDYDCRPPSNINDNDISEDSKISSVFAQPDTTFTQTSAQRFLLQSLPIRLRIIRNLNGLRIDRTYDEALRLSRELMVSYRSTCTLLESMAKGKSGPQPGCPSCFQVKLITVLTRRFFHSLHSPFAMKSLTDLQYYYSRCMHLESALELISILAVEPSAEEPGTKDNNDLNLIQFAGRGLFKCTFLDASQTVCFELIQQLQENVSPTASSTAMSTSRKELYQAVQSLVSAGKRRIESGETNVKSYVFCSGVLAQADAMLAGEDVHKSIMEAARRSLRESYELLRARAVKTGIAIPKKKSGDARHESSIVGNATDEVMSQDWLSMPSTTADLRNRSDHWIDFSSQNLGTDFDTLDLWQFLELEEGRQ
ncbi:hypothetical protein B0J13DRAFT_553382 [Dactylonectria estremocensis]|uniref:Zn(2)-C6 fungal-type domain-containing protein n=1 Tax=Dactylonectria estremocensis TaxID=1079267 RepID=A0A9P9J8H3_9HYPO|nr:hypothetical protein B0J13DRAFT_553382 [Dactylonectria estremocensis]